jgi:epoxyqueuosine reductase
MLAVTSAAGADLKAGIAARAQAAGFDAIGFTAPHLVADQDSRLRAFLDAGLHGDMDWLPATAARRHHPGALWPEARGIIVLAMNYGPEHNPLAAPPGRSHGAISVYAQGRDYHDIVKGKLKLVAGWLHARTGHDVKVFVDTAPVMEKPIAAAAGIGWQGKHTNLVSRDFGSWLFLGAIFTSLPLEPSPEEPPGAGARHIASAGKTENAPAPGASGTSHCGACRRCLDICPTAAFPAPYRLDARRCISYLTIEHKGHIPLEFRAAMGNRIYGCDDCLAVCPWNKFASRAAESKFQAGAMARAPLAELLRLEDETFRTAFAGSPVKRTGHTRFLRNVLIAAGNSGDAALVPLVAARLDAPLPLIRAAAIWALTQLLACDAPAFATMKAAYAAREDDTAVLAEWQRWTP